MRSAATGARWVGSVARRGEGQLEAIAAGTARGEYQVSKGSPPNLLSDEVVVRSARCSACSSKCAVFGGDWPIGLTGRVVETLCEWYWNEDEA